MLGVAVRARDQLVCGQFIAQACEELLVASVDIAYGQSGSARALQRWGRSERGLPSYLPIAEIRIQDGAHHGSEKGRQTPLKKLYANYIAKLEHHPNRIYFPEPAIALMDAFVREYTLM